MIISFGFLLARRAMNFCEEERLRDVLLCPAA